MSQHHFYAKHKGLTIHILIGWELIFNGYYMILEKDSDQKGPFFWSDLIPDECYQMSMQRFINVLKEFGIKLPQKMLVELEEDGLREIANKTVTHSVIDGQYYREETREQAEIEVQYLRIICGD